VLNQLKQRFIQSILLSAVFLQMGIWIRNFSVLLYVTEQTNGNPLAISLITLAEYSPIFLFSFFGGVLADRWKPKKTMIWCDFLSSLSVFIVFGTLLFGSWQSVFFATLISSILSQLSQPAGMKLFKTHLPEEGLQFAMSIYQTLIAVFMIFGPIIGTIVYQNLGINTAILLTGLCFLLSAGALLNIPKDKEQEKEIETRFGQELRSGVKYVLESKELKLLGFCFMVAGLAIGLIQPMNIFIVMEKLQLRGDQLQWLLMANGLGMIFGGIVSMVIARKYPPQRNLAVGVIMSAVTISIIGFSESLPITLGAQFLYGMFLPLIQIAINTMILKNTDSQFIGRVNGILSPLFNGAMVIMIGVSGILKGHVQLTVIYQLSACLFLLTIIFIRPLQKKQVRDKKLEIKESM